MFYQALGKIYKFVFSIYVYLVYIFLEKPRGLDFIRTNDSALNLSSCASYYISIPRKAMKKILFNVQINSDDAFLDIGCGKGFVLYLAYKMGFNRVHGIDLVLDLCNIAYENMNILKIRDKVTVECIDATEFKDLDNYSLIFLNNPFSAVVMEKVIQNIENSLKRNPRNLTIIYLNPRCHQILDNSLLLQLSEKRFIRIYNPIKKWRVYYYKSILPEKSV